MKELSIEEKAKRYDDLLVKLQEAKVDNNVCDDRYCCVIDVIVPELKESEDERMIQYFNDLAPFDNADELYEKYGFSHKDAISWLEAQGEHANFINKIQIGDKVTRNEDGVLVNLSQLNRVAKKQGEQKHADTGKGANGNEREIPIPEPPLTIKHAKEVMGIKQNDAWSEGDEKMFEHIIAKATLHFSSINYLDEEEINFLKALRPQKQWKPSEEQMNLLREVQQALLGRDCHNRFVNFMYELKRLREK